MAVKSDLSLAQAADKLNDLFHIEPGEGRKLVFWFDSKGDFESDLDELSGLLTNAKVRILTGTNQFATKVLLERNDRESNYLIYAPFPRPAAAENHLEDMILYSTLFQADRISTVMLELGMDEGCRSVMEAHGDFWNNGERRRKFNHLDIETYNAVTIPMGILAVLAGAATISFEEIMRSVLSSSLTENPCLSLFEKYGVLDFFWSQVEKYFGYNKTPSSLTQLVISLFVTAAEKEMERPVPDGWKALSYPRKSGNILSFLDNLRHNEKYRELYDGLSETAAEALSPFSAFASWPVECLLKAEAFKDVDRLILEWLYGRLMAEDVTEKVGNLSMADICELRSRTHFGRTYAGEYALFRAAMVVIGSMKYHFSGSLPAMKKEYSESWYTVDRGYRDFYLAYDGLEADEKLEKLRQLVENIYTNEYMGHLLPAWNEALLLAGNFSGMNEEKDFFKTYLAEEKEKTMVIISDGLRYEAGRELYDRLLMDEKASAEMDAMTATLPSYTRLGMAALLPHDRLELKGCGKNMQEQADGTYCVSLAFRSRVLSLHVPQSGAYQMADLNKMKKEELRNAFNGKQLIYVYQDQVDEAGENKPDDVLSACERAVEEIYTFIRRMSGSANVHKFMVTADHGFLYKRDGFSESEKIESLSDEESVVKRRYILAKKPVLRDGVCHMAIKDILGGPDDKIVSFPYGLHVFKASGSLSYVHGGSSPQELIIPLVTVKMERAHVDTKTAGLTLLTPISRVTSKFVSLEFLQSEPVTAETKAAEYLVYFLSSENEKVSTDAKITADSESEEPDKRRRSVTLRLKDNYYFDRDRTYYLEVVDTRTGVAILHQPLSIELAIQNRFGF